MLGAGVGDERREVRGRFGEKSRVDLGRDGFELFRGVGEEAEVYFLDDLGAGSARNISIVWPSKTAANRIRDDMIEAR